MKDNATQNQRPQPPQEEFGHRMPPPPHFPPHPHPNPNPFPNHQLQQGEDTDAVQIVGVQHDTPHGW